ncbi:hypothetical protein, partial [Brevibacterium casei]|uniref:hypothetical protein n=1 Tax=Brevibacterium casei TaxID=33889 RepID=UPI001C92F975
MIYELGVDTKVGWEQVLNNGRTRWRERQLRTAVTDNLHVAAEVLRSRGFTVEGGGDVKASKQHGARRRAVERMP